MEYTGEAEIHENKIVLHQISVKRLHIVHLKAQLLNKAFSEIKLLQNLKWETTDVRCHRQH